MDAGKIMLMVMLYMLSMIPMFGWLILGGTGTIVMDVELYDTISLVLVGFTVAMLFIVMPFIVLPRLTGSRQRDEGD